MEFAVAISLFYDALLETFLALILFSILIVMVWPKDGYDQTTDVAGRLALIVMHTGIVIFRLAILLVFSFFALLTLFVGLIGLFDFLASLSQ